MRQPSGVPICVTGSYRTDDQQVAIRAARPHLRAVPGTSSHRWAVGARLVRRNSLRHGGSLPAGASEGGSKPEPCRAQFDG